jgi:transcriptional regulator with XRE-family HTH domain
MNPTFGARLRLQRERREIALATIAEQTKIKLSLLEALERDDLSHWPLGIFGRSYIRSYAQAIGLDPAATVREFIERHPGSVESPATELSEVQVLTPEKASRRPPTRLEVLIDSAIDAIQARRAEHGQRSAHSEPAPSPSIAYSESVAPRQRSPAVPAPEPLPLDPKPLSSLDLLTVAQLCTRLGCAQEASEVTTALEDAAMVLDAVGLILWIPDSLGMFLTPVFAHGYPDEIIAHMSRVSTDANNASAEAFRTLTTCIVNGSELSTGAIVAPLLTPLGGAGVLAVELRNGAEQREDIRAAITILAAQVSTLMGFSVLAAHTLSA